LISTSCAPVAGRELNRSGSPERREVSSGSPLEENEPASASGLPPGEVAAGAPSAG
jgi:hypothetical protein